MTKCTHVRQQMRSIWPLTGMHLLPWQYYLLNLRKSPCELMTVGRIFHDSAYALAFDLTNLDFIPFSEAIVYLRETGEISRLEKTYQVRTLRRVLTLPIRHSCRTCAKARASEPTVAISDCRTAAPRLTHPAPTPQSHRPKHKLPWIDRGWCCEWPAG